MIKKQSFLKKATNKILKEIDGVVHIGANTGQERDLYKNHNLNVLWIEPIPDVFTTLKENIANYPRQKAFQALLTDKHGKEYKFNIASNNGASSSILGLKKHNKLWPSVYYEKTLQIKSTTLQKLIIDKQINIKKYQALVLDTQGSELLVLKGSIGLLKNIKYISTEVANFESYKDCCKLDDMILFMNSNSFVEVNRTPFIESKDGEIYYEVLFKNTFSIE